MAGTEEAQEETADTSPSDDSADRVVDADNVDAFAERGPVDDNIRVLALSDLHSRLHTVKTWKAQGSVTGEPVLLIRDAVREWLASISEEIATAEVRAANPQPPAKEPCDVCGGVDLHKPACATLIR